MDKLLVLGGKPIASTDIVYYAKSKGVYTIVADYLPKESSPAKKIADETWNISTADVDAICRKIEKENITAIFTGVHEFNIAKAIEISEREHLNFYVSSDVYHKLSNKDIYKAIFENVGMPKIKEFYKGNSGNVDYNNIVYPVIVKPTDGSGGFGVKKCYNEEELRRGIAIAVESSEKGNFMIEECIEASEVTIFYIIQNGKIYLSAMADRVMHTFNKNIIPLPVLYTFPSEHLDSYLHDFNDEVVGALTDIGVENGMLFLQAFWKDGLCYIYDIGFRLTGTQEYNLISAICGYNPMEMLTDYSLVGRMGLNDVKDLVDPYFYGQKAAIVTLLMQPGTIRGFRGIETIKSMKGVIKFVLNHEIGEVIPESALGTLVQVVARAFVVVPSSQELNEIVHAIRATFSVIGDNGERLDILID